MHPKNHYHHHHHHHFDAAKAGAYIKPPGFIKRTIRGLAAAFNISAKFVVIGFILLFMFTGFFALIVFLVAAHWVRNPAKYDDFFGTAFEKSKRGFDNMRHRAAYAEQAAADAAYHEDDFDFSDLNRKFEDLKRRTGGMEEHVSSTDYTLNKEFNDLK